MDRSAPPAGRTVSPGAWSSPMVSGSRASARPAGAARAHCWQAGHTSLDQASSLQPAATALARLSASPSAAGSANPAPHPAMSHQAAGTRIWSPMTQCSVIATGPVSGSKRATGCRSSRSPSGRRRTGPNPAIRPARRATPDRLACLGKLPELTGPRITWRHGAAHPGRRSPGSGEPAGMSRERAEGLFSTERPATPVCYTPHEPQARMGRQGPGLAATRDPQSRSVTRCGASRPIRCPWRDYANGSCPSAPSAPGKTPSSGTRCWPQQRSTAGPNQTWWQTDDFWQYALFAAGAYYLRRRQPGGRPGGPRMPGPGPAPWPPGAITATARRSRSSRRTVERPVMRI
jgi:hypothetical protein